MLLELCQQGEYADDLFLHSTAGKNVNSDGRF